MTDNTYRHLEGIASTYSTDVIFILGKGPSIDLIDPHIFASALTIGVNDAEQITPIDITVFQADWVKRGLKAAGYRSRLYLTSADFSAYDRDVVRLAHEPLTQETSDMMIQRLLGDEIVIEDVLFVSALEVARAIGHIRGRRQTIYMTGFDFSYDTDHAYSQKIVRDYVEGWEDDRRSIINIQENYFLNAMYHLKGSDLDVIHVGRRNFSGLTPDEFNQLFSPETRSDGAYRTKVVAELTTNHFGDRLRLERMVRAARAAGADMIKVQKRDIASFYSVEQLAAPYHSPFGKTFEDYRRQIELSAEDFAFLDELCKRIGVGWFASVLDLPSFQFMMDFDPEIIKLPSTISEHSDYLAFVAGSFSKSVVVSTGMTDEAYEEWVTGTFRNCETLYLMQANSAYPTPLADCGIGIVRRYADLARDDPRIVPAYSSHDYGWFGSALAVAAGACMVEKHVKLGSTDWAHFDAVAVDLTTTDFKDFVVKIREAEDAVGDGVKAVRTSEHHKYRRIRVAG